MKTKAWLIIVETPQIRIKPSRGGRPWGFSSVAALRDSLPRHHRPTKHKKTSVLLLFAFFFPLLLTHFACFHLFIYSSQERSKVFSLAKVDDSHLQHQRTSVLLVLLPFFRLLLFQIDLFHPSISSRWCPYPPKSHLWPSSCTSRAFDHRSCRFRKRSVR